MLDLSSLFSHSTIYQFEKHNNLKSIVKHISKKYKSMAINPNDINFKNIILDITSLHLWEQLYVDLNINWKVENVPLKFFLYKEHWTATLKNHYENLFKKSQVELIYYPFILSVISDIVCYYGDIYHFKGSKQCIKNALDIINVVKKLVTSGRTVFKKDGYFAEMINNWNIEEIAQLVEKQEYSKHILLSAYLNIKYEDLFCNILLKLEQYFQEVTSRPKTDNNINIISKTCEVYYKGVEKLSPFWISFNFKINNDESDANMISFASYAEMLKKHNFFLLSDFDLQIEFAEKDLLEKITNYFSNTIFDFDEHQLTTNNKRQDVYNLIYKCIRQITKGDWFNLQLDGSMEEFISNSSQEVPTGDIFNFKLKIISNVNQNSTSQFSFKIKNVLIIPQIVEKIQEHFQEGYDFDKHKLITISKQQDVYNFVMQEIYKVVGKNNDFSLQLNNFQAEEKIISDDIVMLNTVSFEFVVAIGTEYSNFIFIANNVLTVLELLTKIVVFFDQTFNFNVHNLTIHHTLQDAYNIANNLIKEISNGALQFELSSLEPLTRNIKGNSEKVFNGDQLHLQLKVLNISVPLIRIFYFKFINTNYNIIVLRYFFEQQLIFNLDYLKNYSDIFEKIKQRLAINLSNIYSGLNRFNFNIFLDEFIGFNMTLKTIDIWRNFKYNKVMFKFKFYFENKEYLPIIDLKNIVLSQKNLVDIIKQFFAEQYDLNISVNNTCDDVLKKINIKLKEFLGEKYFNKVEISLDSAINFDLKNQPSTDEWAIRVKVNDEVFENEIKIRLKNIKSDFEQLCMKTIDFFDIVKNWDITTEHNGWYILEKAKEELKKIIGNDINRIELSLLYSESYQLKSILGLNYWYLKLKIDNKEIVDKNQENAIKLIAIISHNDLVIKVRNFFNQQHDWNIVSSNDGVKVLAMANKQLRLYLGNKEVDYSRVEIKLNDFQKSELKFENCDAYWKVIVKVDGKDILTNTNDEIGIKLKKEFNFEYNNILINNIGNYFDTYRNFKFNMHGLMITNTWQDVYNLVKQWIIDKFTGDLEFTLELQNFKPTEFLKTHYRAIWGLTNYYTFNFIIKIGTQSKPLSVRISNIAKNINEGNIFKVIEYFEQEFSFSQHQLTIKNHTNDVKNLVEQWVKNIIGDVSFILETENRYLTDWAPSIKNGDIIEFQIKIGEENGNFTFKAKNVVRKEINQVIFQIIEYFGSQFDFNEHNLTTGHMQQDAYQMVSWLIKHFTKDLSFQLTLKNNQLLKKNIINNLKTVQNGDSIDFQFQIFHHVIDFKFNIKDVQGKIVRNFIRKIQQFFNKTFDFNEHQLTTQNIRQDAFELVKKLIIENFSYNLVFKLEMKVADESKNMSTHIVNNSYEVPTGDWFDMKIFIGSEVGEFRFEVKNVLKNLDEIWITRIQEFFNKTFDFNEHQFTTQNIRQDALVLAKKWIKDKFLGDIPFELIARVPSLPSTNNIINHSEEVPTGDIFNFVIFVGKKADIFDFKIKNVGS